MAKKTFKASVQESTSPASAFISAPTEETNEEKPERKSVRVNLLFRPSTKENIEKLAHLNRTSINDFINTVLDAYIEEHRADIAKYDSFYNE